MEFLTIILGAGVIVLALRQRNMEQAFKDIHAQLEAKGFVKKRVK